MLTICVLALALHSALAVQPFSWTVCSPADSPITVSSISVEPSPVVVPGDVFISVDGASTRQLSHTSLSLTIKRKTLFGEISIPCLLNVGSCTYNDTCSLMAQMDVGLGTYNDTCSLMTQMEVGNWAGISADLSHKVTTMLANAGINLNTCPQPVQQLHVSRAQLTLGEIPAVLSFFAAGDYHVHVSAKDLASGKEILCLDLQLSMKEKCSGLGCIFG